MSKALVFNIMRYSVHDGPGIRTAVFFKGCPLNCKWCHNPESISPEPQQVFYPDKCIKCGGCDNCPTGARETIGRVVTLQGLMDEVKKDRIFFDQSGGGVTLSGGEPLYQPDFLLEFLDMCAKEYIHTAVDTSGFCETDTILKIAEKTRLFLYDIKFFDEEKHNEYCGVSNKLILENLKAVSETKAKIWVRIPVIPGINDDIDEMKQIYAFIKDLKNIEAVCLLPYHNIQSEKYKRLGMEYTLKSVPADESPNITEIKDMFSNKFKTKTGG